MKKSWIRDNISMVMVSLVVAYTLFYGIKTGRFKQNRVIRDDVISYYAYLPATLIYHDLSFRFVSKLPPDFKGEIWTFTSPNGRQTLKMTMGVSVLLLPFFLIAHILALIFGFPSDGYSSVYQLFILFAALFYFLAGLLYIRKILNMFFREGVVALTILVLSLGTNLFYYTAVEPGMSHVYSFFLFSAFLYYTLKWHDAPGIRNSVLLAIMAGLIILVRPSNILVLLLPVLYLPGKSLGDKLVFLWNEKKSVLLIILIIIVVFISQIIYWRYSTGKFIFYSYGEEHFFFNHPHIIKGLLSYRKGWLVYTPVMIFALAGFCWMPKRLPRLVWPMLVFFLLNIYVIFSWWCWWYGGSFGSRPLIESYAILSLPLALVAEKITRSRIWIKAIATLFIIFFIHLNLFQTRQYRISLLHWDSISKELYWKVFLNNKWPDNYKQLLDPPDYDKAMKNGVE